MKRLTAVFAAVVAAAGLSIATPAPASAGGPVCKPTWVIGVGGFQITWSIPPTTAQNSLYFWSDQPVGYNSLNTDAGVAELDRLFWQYRGQCPGSHIKMIGHSGGAAVIHTWVSRNKTVPNATAVLLADPKRPGGPGGPGIAANPLAPLAGRLGIFPGAAGVDADFGDFPVVSVCNAGDWVCNSDAPVWAYLNTRVHVAYVARPEAYPNFSRGSYFLPVY